MKAEIYWIPGPWLGRLGISARPRGGDWLADEVQAWRAAGLDVVTSLLTPDEVDELGFQDEEALARQQGLAFYVFPIPDRGVPRSPGELAELVARLERELASGKNLAVHCRQGIGRSSLVAAALLVAAGEEPFEAFRQIENVRGTPVPDTREQRAWLGQMTAESLAAKAPSG